MAMIGRLTAALLIAGAALSAPAFGQTYPDRLVRIVVPYPAGGGVDGMARALGEGIGLRPAKLDGERMLLRMVFE